MRAPGELIVVDVRVQALARAIAGRDWQDVEWEHDRVRRAVQKAIASAEPARGERMGLSVARGLLLAELESCQASSSVDELSGLARGVAVLDRALAAP